MHLEEGCVVTARNCIGDQRTEAALAKCLLLERTRTATKKKDDAENIALKSTMSRLPAAGGGPISSTSSGNGIPGAPTVPYNAAQAKQMPSLSGTAQSMGPID